MKQCKHKNNINVPCKISSQDGHGRCHKRKSLNCIKAGKNVTIRSLACQCPCKNRLLAMGFLPGTKIKVINCNKNGPMIVEVKNNTVTLGDSMAQNIEVA